MEQIKIIVETLAVAITGFLFIRVTNRSMQILQQEHYILKGYISYTKKYYLKDRNNIFLLAHLLYIPFLKFFGIQIVFIITLVFIYFYYKPPIVKKLVFTSRIRRLYFTHFVLIIMLYTFLLMKISFAHLSQITLLSLILSPIHLLAAYLVNWPLEHLINLFYLNKAKIKLRKISPQIIAITGSYGKTTTKNIIYELIKNKYITTMSPASYNTLMGLCRTINYFARKNDEVLILEMGATHKGDIEKLVSFAKPNYSIITEIGPQHLETFKDIDNIISEKFKIVTCLEQGLAILNYDNEYIRGYPEKENINVISIGIIHPADFYAEEVEYTEKGLSFRVVGPNTNIKIETKLLGRHNIYNILLSIALVKSACFFSKKITDEEIAESIRNIKPIPHRLSTNSIGQLTIIDDSFNSNYNGFINALEILKMSKKPRILITPGIVEMGPLEYETNKSLAQYIAKSCEKVYLVDNPSSRAIKEGLCELGYQNFVVVKSFKIAYNDSVECNKEGTILIENDLTDNLIYRG